MKRLSLSETERDALTLALAVLPLDYPVEDEEELDALKLFLDTLAAKLDEGRELFSRRELELLYAAATSASAFLSRRSGAPLPDEYADKLRPYVFAYIGIASRLRSLPGQSKA